MNPNSSTMRRITLQITAITPALVGIEYLILQYRYITEKKILKRRTTLLRTANSLCLPYVLLCLLFSIEDL